MFDKTRATMSDESSTPVGILLTNLGSPDAPTPLALRRYLKQFLSDPRVIEMPRALWWLILNGIILNVRPQRSARLYSKVWTQDGAPLLAITRRQGAALETALSMPVAVGMRYGNPSIASALEELRERGCTRIVVLPAYPQYFAGTTGSTFDAVATTLSRWRRVPAHAFVADYHDEPTYIAALAATVRETWDRDGEPERLLFSFHGIPVRYEAAGDPYPRQCRRTATLVAEALGLPYERWLVAFQSRFGREKWLEPYTDHTLQAWAREGIRAVDVVCPGFSADCLETLEEIAILGRDQFLQAGGTRFRYIPALNDRPDHIHALAAIAARAGGNA